MENELFSCVICLEELTSSSKVAITRPCLHRYWYFIYKKSRVIYISLYNLVIAVYILGGL